MATQLQLRRDTAADLGSSTPVVGEPGIDTTNKRLVVGDGVRAGGIPHVNFIDLQSQDFVYCTVGGTANAITLAVSATEASLEAYIAGTSLWFKATADNTGAVTFNVDGLGVRNGKKFVDGAVVALEADDIRSGGLYNIVDDGTQLIVQGISGAAGTKEFIVPWLKHNQAATFAYNDDLAGIFPACRLTSTENAMTTFFVPNDFTALTEVVVFCLPDATETIQWDTTTSWGAVGEAYNANSDGVADDTQSVTASEITELDVSDSFTGIAAGDHVGFQFASDTSNIKLVGVRIKYT